MRARRLLKTLLIGLLLALEVPGHRKFVAVDSTGALRQVFGPNEAYRGSRDALAQLRAGEVRRSLSGFFLQGAETGSAIRTAPGTSWGEALERMRPGGADAPLPPARLSLLGGRSAGVQAPRTPGRAPALDRSPPVRPLLN